MTGLEIEAHQTECDHAGQDHHDHDFHEREATLVAEERPGIMPRPVRRR
jgi:hypothetical protein